jgi:hypothetical protein
MSSKYGLLSFLVLALVVLLIFKNYEIWTQPVEWAPEENIGKKPQTKPENRPEVLSTFGTQKYPASIKPYISIAEKNVFSPERKDFPIPAGNGKKQLARPQVILYGVTMAGDYQAASVANPGRPLQKGERETFTVKKGERIGGYKLVEVSSDRVTLEAEGDTFEVLLYDQSMPKRRSEIRTEIKPTTITSAQPGPSAPVPGSPPPMPPVTSTVVPKPALPMGAGQERVVTPPPPTPGSQSLPRRDFPRRRMYSPPSVPSQKTEAN